MNLAKQILTILVVSFVSSAVSAKIKPLQLSPKDKLAITAHRFKSLTSQKLIVLDVRSEKKFQEESIKNSIHFNISFWEESFAKIMDVYTGEEIIVAYCDKGCGSSKSAVSQLRQAGVKKTFYVHNGFDTLKKLGLETQGLNNEK